MSCLGERLTALVDGELGHEERDRALAHLALCDRCRSEADGLRRLKGRLRGLSGVPSSDGADDLPSGDFMARLRSLGEPGAAPVPEAREGLAPPLTRPARSGRPQSSRPRDNRPAGRAAAVTASARYRAPHRRALAVGAATLVLGLGTASYVAGGPQDAPAVSPAFDRFAVEHALISGDAPMPDPLTEPTSVPLSPEP